MLVGLLLFEGGLHLDVRALQQRRPVLLLVTVGVAITWVCGTVSARLLLHVDWWAAALIGAVLVVSGPTVVMPLLRQMRIAESANRILQFEGILIDPVGASLAVVLLTAVLAQRTGDLGLGLLENAGVGILFGAAGAGIVVVVIGRYWLPEELSVPFTIAIVVAAFAASEAVRSDAGLFATTTAGIVIGNQRRVPVHQIEGFGGVLGTLIIGPSS